YRRTLVSAETRFERYLRRADPRILNGIERDGYLIFDRRADCSSCHSLSGGQSEFWRGAPLHIIRKSSGSHKRLGASSWLARRAQLSSRLNYLVSDRISQIASGELAKAVRQRHSCSV